MSAPADTDEEIAGLMTRAERHLRASRGRLRRVASDEADLAVRVGCSVAALLDDHLPELLGHERDYRTWFKDEYLRLFGPGLDRLNLLLVVGQHLSQRCIEQSASATRPAKLEAVLELQAHSILVANEVLELLRGGWPAGAEARWRTLHEIEVVALFLTKAPNTVSQRYLDSWATAMHRLARTRTLRLPPGRGATALRKELRSRAEAAVAAHGPELKQQYGWAARWLRKRQVHFADLERKVAPRRPAYVSASNRVHAGRVGALYSLVERADHFMTGRRCEGLADISLQTVWSANNTTGAMLATAREIASDDSFLIWDEAQTEIAAEADLQLRRAEMSRLIKSGRGDEATAYLASPSASLVRLAREVVTPRT